jgi:hypothetical protein
MVQKEIRTFVDEWLDEVTKAANIKMALKLYDDDRIPLPDIRRITELSEDEFQAALKARDEASKIRSKIEF